MEVGGIGHGGQAWRLAAPERNLETEDHLCLPGVLSWGLALIGSQSCPISGEVLPFLTWIRGSQRCAQSQLGRGMLLGKQAAGRRV